MKFTDRIYPSYFKKFKHIFLLSHMRANTSLLGHILGNHPEIEGYYEMHIGYYSWKSLYRQRMIYFKNNQTKRKSRYIFDKILHNEHHIDVNILKKKEVNVLISIREPAQTIKSIVKLYNINNKNHVYCSHEGATKYYIERLKNLQKISQGIVSKFLYIDAQCIKVQPIKTLISMTDEFELSTRLTQNYKIQSMTGVGNSGDRSKNLLSGKILPGQSDYSEIELDVNLIKEASITYNNVRNDLIKRSKRSIFS